MPSLKLDYVDVRSKIEQLQLGVDELIIIALCVASTVGLIVAVSTKKNRRGAVDFARSVGAYTVFGTGVRLLGIEGTQVANHCYATTWLTVFFFPVVPLRRHHVEFVEPRAGLESAWIRHEATGLVTREVLRTYLYGYVLFPALILAPMLVGWLLSYFHPDKTMDLVSLVSLALMLSSVPWLVVSLWLVIRWDRKRKGPLAPSRSFAGHPLMS